MTNTLLQQYCNEPATPLQQFCDKLSIDSPAYAPFDFFPHTEPSVLAEMILDGCFGDSCRDAFVAAWHDYQDEQVPAMFE